MQANYEGASRILCEWLQRVFGSVLVHSVKKHWKVFVRSCRGWWRLIPRLRDGYGGALRQRAVDHVGGGNRRRCAL